MLYFSTLTIDAYVLSNVIELYWRIIQKAIGKHSFYTEMVNLQNQRRLW